MFELNLPKVMSWLDVKDYTCSAEELCGPKDSLLVVDVRFPPTADNFTGQEKVYVDLVEWCLKDKDWRKDRGLKTDLDVAEFVVKYAGFHDACEAIEWPIYNKTDEWKKEFASKVLDNALKQKQKPHIIANFYNEDQKQGGWVIDKDLAADDKDEWTSLFIDFLIEQLEDDMPKRDCLHKILTEKFSYDRANCLTTYVDKDGNSQKERMEYAEYVYNLAKAQFDLMTNVVGVVDNILS